MQTAGDLVASAAELTAGMQHGEHHFQSAFAGLLLHVHGNTAAVIRHGDNITGLDDHVDFRAVACQRLVNGVVHDFVHQMMQTGAGRGADIHTRTFPDGLQSLQHLNLTGVIFFYDFIRNFCHLLFYSPIIIPNPSRVFP